MGAEKKDVYRPEKWDKEEYKRLFGVLLVEFCAEIQASFGYEVFGVQELKKESQQTFYAALRHIHRKTFAKDNYILKDHTHYWRASPRQTRSSNYGAYDYEILSDILDVYAEFCEILGKIPDQKGFSLVSGVDLDVVYRWIAKYKNTSPSDVPYSNTIYSGVEGNVYGEGSRAFNLLCGRLVLKLLLDKKGSLEARAYDGKVNPTGCAIVLNNEFYNVQHQDSPTDDRQRLTAGELAGFLDDIRADCTSGEGSNLSDNMD